MQWTLKSCRVDTVGRKVTATDDLMSGLSFSTSLLTFCLTLQSIRSLLHPVGSHLAHGHPGVHPHHSSSSRRPPPTLTRTLRLTTTIMYISLGHHQDFAPWGPLHSGVSSMSTIPFQLLERSIVFRCPPRERLRSLIMICTMTEARVTAWIENGSDGWPWWIQWKRPFNF